MKKYVLLLLVTLTVISCKQQQEYEYESAVDCEFLDDFHAIFCIPENPSQCLPLIIIKTQYGWKAVYGPLGVIDSMGPTDGIVLKPGMDYAEGSDTVLKMDEYVDGNINGKYFFPNNNIESWFDGLLELCYLRNGSKDTVRFYASALPDTASTFFADEQESAMYEKSNEDDKYDFGPNKKNAFLYEILKEVHYYMYNLSLPFYAECACSDDGQIQLYNNIYAMDNHCHDCSLNDITVVYDYNDKLCLLNDFSRPYGNSVLSDNGRSFNFGVFCDFKIHSAYFGDKTCYLIESHIEDTHPSPIEDQDSLNNNIVDFFALHFSMIAAYCLDNGKLVPVPAINGKSSLCIVADSIAQPMTFAVIPDENVLCVPHVEKPHYVFNGKYDRVRLMIPQNK